MKLRSFLALCIVLLAACKKDNKTTVIEPQTFVNLPAKVWYYSTNSNSTDVDLTDKNLYAYDTIYYNSKLQVSKVVMYLVAYPTDSVVFEFTYNNAGNLSQMTDYSTNSVLTYGQTYSLYYNSANKVDSIDISAGIYTDWYGLQLQYDSKNHLERINGYQLTNSRKWIKSFTEFHTNSSNQTDSVTVNPVSMWDPENGPGAYSRSNTQFSAYSPNDTASVPAAYLFKLAVTRNLTLIEDTYNNGFLFQFLSPADMLLFRQGVRTTMPAGVSFSNKATRDENKVLQTLSCIYTYNGGPYLGVGIKAENKKFLTK